MEEHHFIHLERILTIIVQLKALTQYGLIGIKVWICRGEVYGKRDLMLHFKSQKGGKKGGNNRGPKRKR